MDDPHPLAEHTNNRLAHLERVCRDLSEIVLDLDRELYKAVRCLAKITNDNADERLSRIEAHAQKIKDLITSLELGEIPF